MLGRFSDPVITNKTDIRSLLARLPVYIIAMDPSVPSSNLLELEDQIIALRYIVGTTYAFTVLVSITLTMTRHILYANSRKHACNLHLGYFGHTRPGSRQHMVCAIWTPSIRIPSQSLWEYGVHDIR